MRGPVASFAVQCLAVLAAWTAILVVLTVVWEPTQEAIVFGRPEVTLGYLEGSDSRIVELTPTYLILKGNEVGFVRSLYANGAWIVLPARAGGCLTLGPNPS